MNDDIVQQLRRLARMYPQWGEVKQRSTDAADEIERLRHWKAETTGVLGEWQRLGDAVVASMDSADTLGRRIPDIVADRIAALEAEIERLRAEVKRLMDGMELAWGLIANGQNWDATDAVRTAEWEHAKFAWRDQHWHPALDRNKKARRGA